MAKKFEEDTMELNLAPIMNLVMILIPLLLMGIVFEQMGVVNVSAPKLAVGPVTDEPPDDEEKPLQLTIGISTTGFTIAATGSKLPPLEGCPDSSPATVCTKGGKDAAPGLGEVRSLRQKADKTGNREYVTESDAKLQEVAEGYDFRRLYNILSEIKKKYPEETIVNVGADPDIPFELLVQTMDIARFKLESPGDDGTFKSDEDFNMANYKDDPSGETKYSPLFNDVVLAVIQ